MRYAKLQKRLAAVVMAILMLTGITGVGGTAYATTAAPSALVLTRTLYQGCTGADVRAVQTILKQLGYYTGSIDGIYGSKSTAAVKAFQTKNGLYVDGQVGNNTFQKMISTSAIANNGSSSGGSSSSGSSAARSYLRQGDVGSNVLNMQRALQSLGYYNGPLSGNFLSQTLAAVKEFQRRNGLVVDGLAGQATLTLLYSGKAIPNYYYPQPTARPTVRPTARPTATPVAQRTLRYGMYGDDVAAMQSRLYQLGYYTGSINGYYDQATVNAVQRFQSRNNLIVDGVTGPQTWLRMFSSSAISNNTPQYPTQRPTTAPWYPTQRPTAAPWQPTPRPTTAPGGRPGRPGWPGGQATPTPIPPPTATPVPPPTATPEPPPTATPEPAPTATPESPPQLTAPVVEMSGTRIFWQAIPGAVSYYYELTATDASSGQSKYEDGNISETSVNLSGDILAMYLDGATLNWSIKAMGAGGVSGPTATGGRGSSSTP